MIFGNFLTMGPEEQQSFFLTNIKVLKVPIMRRNEFEETAENREYVYSEREKYIF